MDPEERRRRILAEIEEDGEDLVPRLSQILDVSEMTIRRDLKALEEEGLIIRTYGGAVLVFQQKSSFSSSRQRRQQQAVAQKQAIARYAAGLVKDGDIVILEGGTTVGAMVPFLSTQSGLTIVTNSLPILNDLSSLPVPGMTLICAGGMYHPESANFIGPVTNRFFREFHANRLFVSATGFTLEAGATDPEMLGTETKHTMIESAAEVILCLDSSKFGVLSLMKVLSLENISLLITDEGAPAAILEAFQRKEVPFVAVPVEESMGKNHAGDSHAAMPVA